MAETSHLGLRERNRIRTHEEILIAVSTLLGERAFEHITIDDVAQLSGVSRGTVYTYFPDGRDQLVREAYVRIAEIVASDGAKRRGAHSDFTERVIALASAFTSVVVTPEGRFYGLIGSGFFGPIRGATGYASGQVLSMLKEDLDVLREQGELNVKAPTSELAGLLGGAIREMGSVAAEEPKRPPRLLSALRFQCEAMRSR